MSNELSCFLNPPLPAGPSLEDTYSFAATTVHFRFVVHQISIALVVCFNAN